MVGMAQADQPKRDAKKDSPLKDFDLKRYGFKKNGDAYVAVYGRAGQTLPAGEHTAYAYVIFTDTGIYASDSHEAQHADNEEVANKSWHGHKVEFNEEGCIDEIGAFKSEAYIKNHRVIITDTGATQIFKALTVELEILVDDPDNPPPGTTCIVRVAQVFDEAVLALDNIKDDNAKED
ncbi:hypothetical protein [Candidatus Nitrososphaera sp. FF02]|uniref:hypothetical protein n=1 Tax=Candidatus Nitrososphaera sp. FF02 TaxID=3398226 RepID=UPI0039E97CF8